jgi:UDP-glucose 4-epimerase
VFVSSGGTVYGKPEIVPTPEFAPANPITAYGVSKLTIEKYLALYEYCHGLQYRVLRVANPFGPYQLGLRSQGVIAAFMRKALAGEPVEIWGDGSAIRDYLYVDDVVSALEAACTHAGDSRVFNIGSGVGRSLLDLIRTIETVSGLRIETHFKQGRPIDVPTSILDVQLAARELLWSPRIPFEQGMRATWEWISQVGITNSRVERHVQ